MEIDVAFKYSTIKSSFVSIIKKDFNKDILIDACFRTHQIIIYSYQLLRLYILHKYEENTQLKEINRGTLKMLFKALTKSPDISNSGPKPKGENLTIYNEFIQFNEKYFNNISINGKNLSSILDYSAIDMLTNIENNIKLNFFNYVRQYINSTFKLQFKEQLI